MRLFETKNLEFWRRGALPLKQWDRGGSPLDATYSARASRLDSTAYGAGPPT